jgi:hypothetical protein
MATGRTGPTVQAVLAPAVQGISCGLEPAPTPVSVVADPSVPRITRLQ